MHSARCCTSRGVEIQERPEALSHAASVASQLGGQDVTSSKQEGQATVHAAGIASPQGEQDSSQQ
eukprot:8752048-Alexandrium_andersonii.AAC.1